MTKHKYWILLQALSPILLILWIFYDPKFTKTSSLK